MNLMFLNKLNLAFWILKKYNLVYCLNTDQLLIVILYFLVQYWLLYKAVKLDFQPNEEIQIETKKVLSIYSSLKLLDHVL